MWRAKWNSGFKGWLNITVLISLVLPNTSEVPLMKLFCVFSEVCCCVCPVRWHNRREVGRPWRIAAVWRRVEAVWPSTAWNRCSGQDRVAGHARQPWSVYVSCYSRPRSNFYFFWLHLWENLETWTSRGMEKSKKKQSAGEEELRGVIRFALSGQFVFFIAFINVLILPA